MKELRAILPFAKPYKWWIIAATLYAAGHRRQFGRALGIRGLIRTITGRSRDFTHISRLAVLVVRIYGQAI